jgi:hypothetical protein
VWVFSCFFPPQTQPYTTSPEGLYADTEAWLKQPREPALDKRVPFFDVFRTRHEGRVALAQAEHNLEHDPPAEGAAGTTPELPSTTASCVRANMCVYVRACVCVLAPM